ncbi:MAG: hypothetical protein K6360_07595 [Deltaproteobacteria bacterium]
MSMKKHSKIFLTLWLCISLFTAFAGYSQAAGTPAGAIANYDGKQYVVLINFSSAYSAAQIDLGTNIAQNLINQYSSSSMTAQVFTHTQLAQMGWTDADALHAALVPYVGSVEAYFYITATKVANPSSGTNLRFDLKIYTESVPNGMYIGAFELSEPLVNSFIQ